MRSFHFISEYLRPWKLTTLTLGIALLIAGSYLQLAPGWGIPTGFIMAGLAYLTAPWSLCVLFTQQWLG